jgi:hypothetical protein
MAAGDTNAKRGRPDGKSQRPGEIGCFPVDPSVYRCRPLHLQERRRPGPRRGTWPVGWCVEHEDTKLAGVERRAGAASYGSIQGVWVVRNEHHDRLPMLAPDIVGEKQVRCTATGAEHLLRGLQKSAYLVVAVGGLLDSIAVNPKRDVVEEHPAVDLGHVHTTLDPITESIERAGHIMPVHPHVEREVIARPGGDAHERKLVRSRGSGHDSERPITTCHSEGICTFGYCCLSERCQVLARVQDVNVDALLARPFNDPVARGRTPTRPGIDKQHRSSRAAGGAPAMTRQPVINPSGG